MVVCTGDGWKEQLRTGLVQNGHDFHICNATITLDDHDAFYFGFDCNNIQLARLRGLLHAEPSKRGWHDICSLATRLGSVGLEYATKHLQEHWPEPWNRVDTSHARLSALYFDGCTIMADAWEMIVASPLVAGVFDFGVRQSGFVGEPMKQFLENPQAIQNLNKLIITREPLAFDDLDRLGRCPRFTSIRHLSLPNNALTNAALQGLNSAPPSKLGSLDLSDNPITSKEVNFLIGWERMPGRSIGNLFMDCRTLSAAAIRKLSNSFNLYMTPSLMRKMYKTDLVSLVYNFAAEDSVNVNGDKDTIVDTFFDTYDAYWDMGCGSSFNGPGW